jgi:phage gpG-like protein
MAAVIIRNLSDVLAGLEVQEDRLENAAQTAIATAGFEIQRQAQKNANTGSHPRGQRHIPGTGPGPNVVTGTLRRSIRTDVKYGFGNYIAVVGADTEYARAVELGSPRWKSGVKYPYLAPAATDLIISGKLNRVFTAAFIKAVRG